MSKSAMQMLAEDLAKYYNDPLGYVLWAFPWGKGALKGFDGPRKWQREFLIEWGREIRERGFKGVDPVDPIQMSRASGHGIGKSALSAWIIKFITDTRPFCKGVVTANTGEQLKTKTWAELGKWHKMSVTRELFTHNNTKGNMCFYNKEHPDTWRVDAMTCREENSEAFAGLHAATSTPFYLFDEASAVPEKIYEVAQGGLTDGEPMWFLFGNPTRNTGFFRQTFAKLKHRWNQKQIDSRDVKGTNKKLFEKWIQDYGVDSDFVRVRVRGIFPRASVTQMIPGDLVQAAMGKHLRADQYNFAPKILGVDVAWEGDDRSTIWFRQGLYAKRLWQGREASSVQIAGLIAQFEDQLGIDATFIDAGYGNGVIDQLRALGRNPIAVWFGGKSTRNDCTNKRTQMWADIKDWLELGPAIPNDQELYDDLVGPEKFMNLNGQMQLEPKKDMKKRGLASPDDGDGLALTFAQPVHKQTPLEKLQEAYASGEIETEYDVLDTQAANKADRVQTDYELF